MNYVKKFKLEFDYLLQYISNNKNKNNFDFHLNYISDEILRCCKLNKINVMVVSDIEQKHSEIAILDDYISNEKFSKCMIILNNLWRYIVCVFNGIN